MRSSAPPSGSGERSLTSASSSALITQSFRSAQVVRDVYELWEYVQVTPGPGTQEV